MSSDELNAIIERIASGTQTSDDLEALRVALTDPSQELWQLSKYIVTIGQGRDIHIGDRFYVTWNDEAIDALIEVVQKLHHSTAHRDVLDATMVEPYLRSLITNEKSEQKRGFYTPTDAIAVPELDLALMAQLVQSKKTEDEHSREPKERLPVLEGIRNYAAEHVLLIGRPGSGKSTALRRLLVEEAQKALKDPSAKIPVLVKLRDCDTGQPSVLEQVKTFLQSHNLDLEETILKNALVQGRLLLLVDGVNELPSHAAQRAVVLFRQAYPKTPMIFTTRDVALGGDLGIEKKLEMQPLSEPQMQKFVQTYLSDQGEIMLRQLQGRLWEMGKTPLLLGMLCEVFQALQQLPSSLGGLFRSFAKEYDRRKQYVPVSEGLHHWKSELLQHLAFTMMQAEEPAELRVAISRQEAETVLTKFLHNKKVDNPAQRAKEWLEDLLKHHLIQHTSQDQLEFHHQLFQEYYAAEALLKRLPDLSDEQLKREYLNYLKWTEPLALMLELVEKEVQALNILKLALHVDLMLGARLTGNVKQSFKKQAIELLNKHELKNEQDMAARLKIELLARTLSDEAIPFLLGIIKKCNSYDGDDGYNAVRALGKIGTNEAIITLGQVLHHPTWNIGFAVVEALEEISTERVPPTLLDALSDALSHEDLTVRCQATDVISSINSDLTIHILQKALRDDYGNVRKRAMSGLAKFNSKETFESLIVCLRDTDRETRWTALNIIKDQHIKTIVPYLQEVTQDLREDSCIRRDAQEVMQELNEKHFTIKEIKDKSLNKEPHDTESNLFSILDFNKLIEALKPADLNTCQQVEKLIYKLGEPSASKLLKMSYDDLKVNSRVARILTEASIEEVISKLETIIDKATIPDERLSASLVLRKIALEAAIPKLKDALKDWHFFTRLQAAKLLGELGLEDAVPALIEALNDQEYEVRMFVAESLGKIGSELAVFELINALQDDHRGVRYYAAEALGKIASEESILALVTAWKEEIIDDLELFEIIEKIEVDKAICALSHLPRIILTKTNTETAIYYNIYYLFQAIASLQTKCRFYNYAIWQTTIQNKG